MENNTSKVKQYFVSLLFYTKTANVLMLILAMYISAFFLFEKQPISVGIKNIKIHGIIIASALSAMAGYIINHFYKKEKHSIQEPFSTKFRSFISNNASLKIYITLNVISLIIAGLLSYRLLLFFIGFQFFIWYYSHSLSKILFINNISAVLISIIPFLALFIFYENITRYILLLASLLFLLLLIKDLCKDVDSSEVDNLFEYKTIANTLGIQYSRAFLWILLLLACFCSILLYPDFKHMEMYYSLTAVITFFLSFYIWFMPKPYFKYLVLLTKSWICIGTVSLLFRENNFIHYIYYYLNK